MGKAIPMPSGSVAEALTAGIVSALPVHTKMTVETLTSSTVCTALNRNEKNRVERQPGSLQRGLMQGIVGIVQPGMMHTGSRAARHEAASSLAWCRQAQGIQALISQVVAATRHEVRQQ